jgi:peptidoglycan/LPS O-acetylase OafA/YrhL
MRSRNTSYLSRLDHLRFLAAALVIVYHYTQRSLCDFKRPICGFDTDNPLLALIDQGHTGVALFMVVSGFIFAVIAFEHSVAYWPFIKNRLIRIYPLYIFAILLSLYIGRQDFDFISVVGAIFPFLNLRNPVSINYFDQLWTIAVEFQFYLIFPFLWHFFRLKGERYLFALILLGLVFRLVVYLLQGTVQDLAYWTIFGRLDQFVVGMLLGVLYCRRDNVLSHPLWLVLAVALLLGAAQWLNKLGGFYGTGYPSHSAFWIWLPTAEALLWGFLILSYLNCRIGLPSVIDRGLAWLGQASFSLYVMHNMMVFLFLKEVGSVNFISGHNVLNAVATALLLVLPATVLLAALTVTLIEKPFLAYRVRYLIPTLGPAEQLNQKMAT